MSSVSFTPVVMPPELFLGSCDDEANLDSSIDLTEQHGENTSRVIGLTAECLSFDLVAELVTRPASPPLLPEPFNCRRRKRQSERKRVPHNRRKTPAAITRYNPRKKPSTITRHDLQKRNTTTSTRHCAIPHYILLTMSMLILTEASNARPDMAAFRTFSAIAKKPFVSTLTQRIVLIFALVITFTLVVLKVPRCSRGGSRELDVYAIRPKRSTASSNSWIGPGRWNQTVAGRPATTCCETWRSSPRSIPRPDDLSPAQFR